MGISSKRRQLSRRLFGLAMTRTASAVVGGSLSCLGFCIHALWAVNGRDVATEESASHPVGGGHHGIAAGRRVQDVAAGVGDRLD